MTWSTEAELAERYHDTVVERCGIREFVDDGAIDPDHAAPLLVSVFLDKDLSFVVSTEAEARAFVAVRSRAHRHPPGPRFQRLAGDPQGGHRDPRAAQDEAVAHRRRADPDRLRPDRVGHLARTWPARSTGWRCGTSSRPSTRSCRPGFSPTELMRWVHPSLVANTQGTGMGGMTSMQSMYLDNLLGENKPNDILQEALPNVVAAHVVQSYVGSYGAMIHPVAACATAAVSVEEGVDKIRLGKAELVVAGGFDDLTLEAIIGFGDMSATADTEVMRAKGISDSKFSRANDRRRLGFVEAQGGGTILLARGDLAAQDGPAGARCGGLRAVASPTACTPRSRLRGSVRSAPAAAARTRCWPARWPSWASAPTTSR